MRNIRMLAFESVSARAMLLVITHGGVLDVLSRHTSGLPQKAPRTFTLLNVSLDAFQIPEGMWALLH
jgi:probable phosphoglycerate mutase